MTEISKHFVPLYVVPTRNRADLAKAALASLLSDPDPRLRVWVSDNSTDAAEIDDLRAHCATFDDPRFRYIRPSEPLPMAQHWEWILAQALADPANTHCGFLTDRMLFVPGAMRMLLDAAVRFPDRLITYPNDHIDDLRQPVRLNQHCWTGRVVEMGSRRVIENVCRLGWSKALPRLLNTLVPRAVFERIAAHYGDILASTAPDVCFGFRALERLDSVLYLDRPVIVDYAIARSNGHSASRGEQTAALVDFLRDLDARGMNFSAPVPGFNGTANTCLHEYNRVRERTHSPKFPRLNAVTAHRVAAVGLQEVDDPAQRLMLTELFVRRRRELIVSGEWRRDLPVALLRKLTAKATPTYLWRKLVKTLSKRVPNYDSGVWRILRMLGIQPYAISERITLWPDCAQALTSALQDPLQPVKCRSEMEYVMVARYVGRIQ